MKQQKLLKVMSSALALSIILTGCSSSSSKSENQTKAKIDFKTSVDNEGTPINDATFKYGILASSPLGGLYHPVLHANKGDAVICKAVFGTTFPTDDALKYKLDDEDAPVKLHLDKEKNEIILTIHDGVKWNNGEDLTSKDIIASYELLGKQ